MYVDVLWTFSTVDFRFGRTLSGRDAVNRTPRFTRRGVSPVFLVLRESPSFTPINRDKPGICRAEH